MSATFFLVSLPPIDTGMTGMIYYLIAYGFMTIGAFAVVIVMRQRGLIGDTLDDLDGLYQRNPAAAFLLLIFMLSLAGIPPTAGFMGKYFIFQALIETASSRARRLCRALYRSSPLLLLPRRRPRLDEESW